MIIQSLRLVDFRNYESADFTFSDQVNVITGANAQGKTNLLEALFFLSRGYSHRASSAADLKRFDSDHFLIKGQILKEDIGHDITVKYAAGKRETLLDGKKKSPSTLSPVLGVLLFEPDDLRIVKAGPDKRRRFMDEEISGAMPGYLPVLKKYRRILAQRNALLKEIAYSASMASLLDTWDGQLAETGARVMTYRLSYLKQLNQVARKLHSELSSGAEKLALFYQNNLIDHFVEREAIEAVFRQRLTEGRNEDIKRGSTQYGPHVDDIVVHINGREARKYASQGQQRTAAVALKLSQMDIYHAVNGDYPVVLLDDILSELDERRQENILSVLDRSQSFITCTDSSFANRYPEERRRIIRIQDGREIVL